MRRSTHQEKYTVLYHDNVACTFYNINIINIYSIKLEVGKNNDSICAHLS